MTTTTPEAYAKLILSTQVAELDDCYLEGFEACDQDAQEGDNPYLENSKEAQFWQDGWWAAFYNEAPAFGAEQAPELVEQPEPQETHGFDYHTWIKRSIQIGSVAVLAAVGMELADVAFANFGVFEIVSMI